MSNLKIGIRLALSFAFMLLLVAILAGVGIWRMQGSTAMAEDLTGNKLKNERLINQLSSLNAENAANSMALAKVTNPLAKKHFEEAMAGASVSIQKVLAELQSRLADAEARAIFADLAKHSATYVKARTKALEAGASGDLDTAQRFFDTEMEGLLDAFTQSVDRLLAYEQRLIDQSAAALHASNELGLKVLVALAAVAVLAGCALAFFITRSITVPLRRAVHFAQTVSARDLTGAVDVKGTDEMSTLLDALQTMNGNLLAVVKDVGTGAQSIASAASEIAAGNIDLSARTEEQASSLAETAATMEQLTTTVRQNADNAAQANKLAASASSVAVKSGEAVTQVVRTMGAINDSAKQIVDIISVIDGIAFQTNILALNAAVEAARAGEQGRGFAVVATEVRSLAQRSASAAKEIKALIDASVSTTEEGNKLVAQAGTAMNETVASIKRVTDIMGEITSASEEQSVGIEQVNQAVLQMDQVTQQNASLVEEAAAASDSLQEQASSLARLVATFKIDARGVQVAQHSTRAALPSKRLALG